MNFNLITKFGHIYHLSISNTISFLNQFQLVDYDYESQKKTFSTLNDHNNRICILDFDSGDDDDDSVVHDLREQTNKQKKEREMFELL